jgi:hypothetical protein
MIANTEKLKNKLEVTKDNFESVIYLFLLGYKMAHYNSESFSTGEVNRYVVIDRSLDLLIDEVIDKGYCPYTLITPIEQKVGLELGIFKREDLKQEIDNDLRIIVNGNVVDFGALYKEEAV